jgi:pyruvate/2-oxoacid:ferredoxin oxidoreductase alpha subunit
MAYDHFAVIKEAVEYQYQFIRPITPETTITEVLAQLKHEDRFGIAQAIMNSTGVCMEECVYEAETFAQLADMHSKDGDGIPWWDRDILPVERW